MNILEPEWFSRWKYEQKVLYLLGIERVKNLSQRAVLSQGTMENRGMLLNLFIAKLPKPFLQDTSQLLSWNPEDLGCQNSCFDLMHSRFNIRHFYIK